MEDVGSDIIDSRRMSLMKAVNNAEARGRFSQEEADSLRLMISTVETSFFHAEVWVLNLRGISRRRYGTVDLDRLFGEARSLANTQVNKIRGQVLQPDEFLLENLMGSEITVIVSG